MLSYLSQFVRNRLLATPMTGWWNRIRGAALHRTERLLLRVGDPLVNCPVGRHSLRLPLSHNLPKLMRLLPDYSRNLVRIAAAIVAKYPDMTCIDIGANVGDSVALMRSSAHFPILCIEGVASYFRLLEQNVKPFGDVEIENIFIGDESQQHAGRVDVHHGTARVTSSAAGGESIALLPLSKIVQRHPRFASPKLIKIDTDGFDVRIIRGSAPLLASAKPVVFFEYYPALLAEHGDDGLSVFPTLGDAGYDELIAYDNFGALLPVDLHCSDAVALREIHEQRVGDPDPYVDFAAFHRDDHDLFSSILQSERAHFR